MGSAGVFCAKRFLDVVDSPSYSGRNISGMIGSNTGVIKWRGIAESLSAEEVE